MYIPFKQRHNWNAEGLAEADDARNQVIYVNIKCGTTDIHLFMTCIDSHTPQRLNDQFMLFKDITMLYKDVRFSTVTKRSVLSMWKTISCPFERREPVVLSTPTNHRKKGKSKLSNWRFVKMTSQRKKRFFAPPKKYYNNFDNYDKYFETSVKKNLKWWNWRFVTKTFDKKFFSSKVSIFSLVWNQVRWVSVANCAPFMGNGTVTVTSLRIALRSGGSCQQNKTKFRKSSKDAPPNKEKPNIWSQKQIRPKSQVS